MCLRSHVVVGATSLGLQSVRSLRRMQDTEVFSIQRGFFMKGYNLVGYMIILAYALACMYFAPPHIGPWAGLLIGAAYFVICWFIGGAHPSPPIHMGVAHRALDHKEWLVKASTGVNYTVGGYIHPVTRGDR